MQILLSLLYGNDSLINAIVVPQYGIWYLLALPFWRLLTHSLLMIGMSLRLVFLFTIVLSMASGFVSLGSEFAFQRFFAFWPFFILGLFLRTKDIGKIRNTKHLVLLSSCILVVLLAIFVYVGRPILSGMCNSPHNGFWGLLSRTSVLILGTIMSLSFLCCVPSMSILNKYGKRTLFIYCYHIFFIVGVVPNIWIWLGISCNIVYCLIYSLLVMLLLMSLSNIKVLHRIIAPLR